jgi:hypothetical protein
MLPWDEQRRSPVTRWSAFFLEGISMNVKKTASEKIFDNIIFLADVFGDLPDKDIPPLPVLEMARCFELAPAYSVRASRRRRKDWPLWN